MKQYHLTADLNYILQCTESIWDEFRNQRIFITGGTGFFGKWLLEALIYANEHKQLNLSIVVLTRQTKPLLHQPHLAHHPALHFHVGDVRNFEFPLGPFSHVIHAATEASAALDQYDPQRMFDTIVDGTSRVLSFAAQAQVKKFLYVSSGAIYGRQPEHLEQLEETYSGTPQTAYGKGKVIAENECILHAKKNAYAIKIARCFAFVGPYLPLDIHFAIGNFIRDGLSGDTITVNGDGTPYRSYLYAADLVVWLLKILCHGEDAVPYNVGSDEAVTIAELAHIVANCFSPPKKVHIAKPSHPMNPIERYVPSVQRAMQQLQLTNKINLINAIKKTITWNNNQ